MTDTAIDENVFERARLWPVRIVLTDAAGVTLWGAGREEGPDVALTVGGRLALFRSPADLSRFVAGGDGGSFAGTPGLASLRAELAGRPLAPILTADYRAVAAALRRPAEEWDLAGLGDLLDAFNLLIDVAAGLPDAGLGPILDDPDLRDLLDRLTFVTGEEVPELARRVADGTAELALGRLLALLTEEHVTVLGDAAG